jgi:hypothetical protein
MPEEMKAVKTVLTAVFAVAALVAQQPIASRVLLATVSVGNRTIVDLDVDDFVVEEGGAAREIFDVHIADYPLVVLVDDGVPADELTTIRDAAARFVTRVGERAMAVGTLTSSTMLASFDDDRAKVLAELKGVSPQPSARPAPLEALAAALGLIREAGTPFSAVVVVSARAIDPSGLESTELLASILESRVPVHVIAHRTASNGPAQAAADVLREVSSLTHGQYTTIFAAASYSIALDRLADRLSTEMMIQFLVPQGATGSGDVRVGVKVPGARVTGLGVGR